MGSLVEESERQQEQVKYDTSIAKKKKKKNILEAQRKKVQLTPPGRIREGFHKRGHTSEL